MGIMKKSKILGMMEKNVSIDILFYVKIEIKLRFYDRISLCEAMR